MNLHVRKLGKGYAGVSVLHGFQEEWIELMMQTRSSFADGYIQAIAADRVLDENHIFFCLYNVVMAHEHGYGKMERIDVEMLLNISGLNKFEDALAQTAPKEGDSVFVVSYAEHETTASDLLSSFMRSTGSFEEYPKLSEEKLQNLAKASWLERRGKLSQKDVLDFLIESSAMFYVRYR